LFREILGVFVAGTAINLVNQRMVITDNVALSLENALLTYVILAIFVVLVNRLSNKTLKSEKPNHVYYEEMNEGVGVHGAIDNLQRLSSQVHENASRVNKASSGRVAFADQVVEMSKHVADSAEKIAESSQQCEEVLNDAANSHLLVSDKIGELNNLLHSSAGSVSDSMSLIGDFHESFDKINGMADAITAISSQTNLLALNAAIEAARAGESGRGFAIVAEEVKELASKSGKSATDISALLEEMAESVEALVAKLSGLNSSMENAVGQGDMGIHVINEEISRMANAISNVSTSATHTTELAVLQKNEIHSVVDQVASLAGDTKKAVEGSAANMEIGCQLLVQLDEINEGSK